MIVLADNFLTGALLTLLIPAATLVAVAIWYTRTVLRMDARREEAGEATAPAPTRLSAEPEPPAAQS